LETISSRNIWRVSRDSSVLTSTLHLVRTSKVTDIICKMYSRWFLSHVRHYVLFAFRLGKRVPLKSAAEMIYRVLDEGTTQLLMRFAKIRIRGKSLKKDSLKKENGERSGRSQKSDDDELRRIAGSGLDSNNLRTCRATWNYSTSFRFRWFPTNWEGFSGKQEINLYILYIPIIY